MSKLAKLGREEIMECQVMWEPDSKKDTLMDRFRAAVGAACGLALGECGARGSIPPSRASPEAVHSREARSRKVHPSSWDKPLMDRWMDGQCPCIGVREAP